MKTSSTELKKEMLVSVCCGKGFTKMVITREAYLARFGAETAGAKALWASFWIPVQTCASCGKECEVEYKKSE